jgi:hypothetical protein
MNTATTWPALPSMSRSADAGAAALPCPSLLSKVRVLVLSISVLALAACSDSPLAPEQAIDRVAAARVMPSVTDARVRVAPGLQNTAIRDRVVHDLGELELALTNGDGNRARFHMRVLGTLLNDYRVQQHWTTDGADVTAISLMLHQVSQAVNGGYVLPTPR